MSLISSEVSPSSLSKSLHKYCLRYSPIINVNFSPSKYIIVLLIFHCLPKISYSFSPIFLPFKHKINDLRPGLQGSGKISFERTKTCTNPRLVCTGPQNHANFSPDQKDSCKQCCNPVTNLNGFVLTGRTGKKFVRSKICPEPCKPCLKLSTISKSIMA